MMFILLKNELQKSLEFEMIKFQTFFKKRREFSNSSHITINDLDSLTQFHHFVSSV